MSRILFMMLCFSPLAQADFLPMNQPQPYGADAYALAQRHYDASRYREAADLMEREIQRVPACARYHHLLGKSYGRMAEQESFLSAFRLAKQTLRSFEQAVELAPDWLPVLEDLARFHQEAPGIVGGSADEAQRVRRHIQQLRRNETSQQKAAHQMENICSGVQNT